MCLFWVKSVRSNDGVADHNDDDDDNSDDVVGGGSGNSIGDLFLFFLSLCVCACWVYFVKCVGSRYHQITLQFSLLVSVEFEFVAACQTNGNIISFILFTRIFKTIHDSFIRFFWLGSSMIYWMSCSGGTYTSYLLRCQMDEIITFEPRILTAFLWLWNGAFNKCILISNFIKKKIWF